MGVIIRDIISVILFLLGNQGKFYAMDSNAEKMCKILG